MIVHNYWRVRCLIVVKCNKRSNCAKESKADDNLNSVKNKEWQAILNLKTENQSLRMELSNKVLLPFE